MVHPIGCHLDLGGQFIGVAGGRGEFYPARNAVKPAAGFGTSALAWCCPVGVPIRGWSSSRRGNRGPPNVQSRDELW